MESTVVGGHTVFVPILGKKSASHGTMTLEKSEVCFDVVSPAPYVQVNPLSLTKKKDGVITVHGMVDHGFLGFHVGRELYTGYPIYKPVASYGTQSIVPLYSYTSEAVSKSMPNQSLTDFGENYVQMPSLIASVKDLASLFENVRKLKFSAPTIGAAYLANEFGIAPLIDDLLTYMKVSDVLDDAATQYIKVERGGTRRGTLIDESSTSKHKRWLATTYSAHSYSIRNDYSIKVWYSIRFRPNGVSPPSRPSLLGESIGLNQPLTTLWNLTPWSFLVDYFVKVGDFISSRNSSHRVRDICVMRHQKAKAYLASEPGDYYNFGLQWAYNNTLKFSGRASVFETKERSVFTDVYGVPLRTFLSRKKIANIVALLAVNSKGK
jgi:hypothetical protein